MLIVMRQDATPDQIQGVAKAIEARYLESGHPKNLDMPDASP